MSKPKNKQWEAVKEMSGVMRYILLGFLAKEIIIYFFVYLFSDNQGQYLYDVFPVSGGFTKGFMLAMGIIISAYTYQPMFVQFGVTRKQTFVANLIGVVAGIGLLVLLAAVLSAIQQVIYNILSISISQDMLHVQQLLDFGEGIESIPNHFLLEHSLFAFTSRWIMVMLTFGLSIFHDYVIGWMIGTGFYIGGLKAGFSMIATGILFFSISDLIWGDGLITLVPLEWISWEWLEASIHPFIGWILAIIGTLAMTIFSLWIIRTMTKKMVITVENQYW